jgi:hypothetical protein
MSIHITYAKTAELPHLHLSVTVRVAESYFEISHSDETCDAQVGMYLEQAIPGWRSYARATRILDLSPSPEAIFHGLSKNTRYEIGRARERDNLETRLILAPDSEEVSEFVEYYDAFADSKGIPPIRRSQFEAVAEAGKLVISAARSREGELLAAHAYLFDRDRARLSHSASLFRLEGDSRERRRIGRANRLLHWEDIVSFREAGVTSYDMGGWYTESQNEALLRINSFKREFGGTVVHEWDAYRPRSPRGWVYVRVRDLAQRAPS